MMAEQKPKIDLKSRLGKKTVSTPGGGSIPPPMGIPKPAGVSSPGGYGAPSPGYGSYAPTPSRPAAPRIDPSDPYASMPVQAAPVQAAPAAIKIELSDEVVAAQKRGRGKIAALAAVTAVVGGFLGFALGSGSERGKAADAAIVGAKELVAEVEAANKKAEELADVLKAAKDKLQKAKYPDEEVSKLGGINIPFSGMNLSGKGIGRFKADILSMLIDYSTAVEAANSQKEKIQNVLSGNKKGVQEFLDNQTKPQVRWSVIVGNGPGGPWGSMQPVFPPFPAKDEKAKWPEEFKIKEGGKEFALKRYTSGNPMGSDPLFIPIDPGSQNMVCPSDVLFKIRRELSDMEAVLRGDNTAGEEKPGLLQSGQQLVEKLKQIGRTS